MFLVGIWRPFMVLVAKPAIRLGNAFRFRRQPEPRDVANSHIAGPKLR